MGLVGSYTLHLYCDHSEADPFVCAEWPGEFTGHTRRVAKAEARLKGWVFKPGYPIANETPGTMILGAVYCPVHADDIPYIKKVME